MKLTRGPRVYWGSPAGREVMRGNARYWAASPGNWYLSRAEYASDVFPRYMSGVGYVLSIDLVRAAVARMSDRAWRRRHPRLHLEDANTGMLIHGLVPRNAVGTSWSLSEGFSTLLVANPWGTTDVEGTSGMVGTRAGGWTLGIGHGQPHRGSYVYAGASSARLHDDWRRHHERCHHVVSLAGDAGDQSNNRTALWPTHGAPRDWLGYVAPEALRRDLRRREKWRARPRSKSEPTQGRVPGGVPGGVCASLPGVRVYEVVSSDRTLQHISAEQHADLGLLFECNPAHSVKDLLAPGRTLLLPPVSFPHPNVDMALIHGIVGEDVTESGEAFPEPPVNSLVTESDGDDTANGSKRADTLFLVLSCHKNRNKWATLRVLLDDVRFLIVVGNPDPDSPEERSSQSTEHGFVEVAGEDRVVQVSAPDTYDALPEKVVAMMRAGVGLSPRPRHIVKMDDDMRVNTAAFASKPVPEDIDYAGCVNAFQIVPDWHKAKVPDTSSHWHSRPFTGSWVPSAMGGFGYILSWRAAALVGGIDSARVGNNHIFEDLMVGRRLAHAGIRPLWCCCAWSDLVHSPVHQGLESQTEVGYGNKCPRRKGKWVTPDAAPLSTCAATDMAVRRDAIARGHSEW